MVTPTFNPANCQYGLWPDKTKSTIKLGATGQKVGYLQAVLKCRAGQPLNPSAFGPWYFNTATRTAVRNFQAWWGITVDGVVGPQTWGLIDWSAKGNPT